MSGFSQSSLRVFVMQGNIPRGGESLVCTHPCVVRLWLVEQPRSLKLWELGMAALELPLEAGLTEMKAGMMAEIPDLRDYL